MSLLGRITGPSDLKGLSTATLPALAQEIRAFLIDKVSYADGVAKAFALGGATNRRVVAIVGDGALTGGMCWEALNNIGGAPNRPVIIVLNDNGRSYTPTVSRRA